MENDKVSPIDQEKTPEQKILEWCVKYVHALCSDDPDGTLHWVLEDTGLSEMELFNGFENLSQDNGFTLDVKIDGVWVKPGE